MKALYATLNMISLLRTFSVIAYFLIFFQGSMILLPFGLLLLTGVFTAEPLMKILIGLADVALIVLMINSFKSRTRWTTLIEIISFVILLLPLLKIFLSFSFDWFNYFLFLFPAGCFVVFFPLSIFMGHRKYIRELAVV
jgi:hypothetical protein